MIWHPTFDAALAGIALPPTNVPLRVAARQMRWLRRAFIDYVQALEGQLGCVYHVDTTRLGTAFVRWLRAMDKERRAGRGHRRQWIDFAASLMLQELMAARPLRCTSVPRHAEPESPAAIWAEGYAATLFCLAVHAAIVRQEYEAVPGLSRRLEQPSFWHSYRENCIEDHRTASGFFQLILGYQPFWDAPDRFRPLPIASAH